MSAQENRQPVRLRQIALIAEDLKESERILTKVLGTNVVYRDPHVAKWGLKNILLLFGGDILEVVSPFQADTTAGRLLEERGDGGYMIIMQTHDAIKRRDYIVQNKLAKVIANMESEDSTIVQYHPKGIKGGVIPELDSVKPSKEYPNPILDPISPTVSLGPSSRAALYLEDMRNAAHLRVVGVMLRLAPNDIETIRAAKQWEELFGVVRKDDLLRFTNAKLGFLAGLKGESEGIHSITIAVNGKERLQRILQTAKEENLVGVDGISMLGVKWYFVSTD